MSPPNMVYQGSKTGLRASVLGRSNDASSANPSPSSEKPAACNVTGEDLTKESAENVYYYYSEEDDLDGADEYDAANIKAEIEAEMLAEMEATCDTPMKSDKGKLVQTAKVQTTKEFAENGYEAGMDEAMSEGEDEEKPKGGDERDEEGDVVMTGMD